MRCGKLLSITLQIMVLSDDGCPRGPGVEENLTILACSQPDEVGVLGTIAFCLQLLDQLIGEILVDQEAPR